MFQNLINQKLVIAAAIILISFMVGFILEKVILRKLHQFSIRTQWEGDEIIIKAMRGIATFWVIAAGMYGAISVIPITKTLFNLLEKVILVMLIFSATLFLAKVSTGFINLYAQKKEGILPSSSIIANLTKLIVYAIGILIILQSLGISITPILTALGVGGLAVALALQDTLSNLFSGLYLIVSKQIKPGDYIKLDSDNEGYVVDISWRNTTIRALANNMIVVPNSKMAAVIITNYEQPGKEMGVLIQVGVSYQSDLEQVERVTLEMAREVMREVPGGIPEFEPAVRFHTFGDFSINFSVVLRAREFADQYLLRHEFIKRLHARYQKEGIEIPFPISTVYLKTGIEDKNG